MNYRLIILILGRIFILSAAAMVPSLFVSFVYKDGVHTYFMVPMALLLVFGIILEFLLKKHHRSMRPREGFVIAALCWITIVIFGALPPYLSGQIPDYIDSIFEMAAGFTTTGATILPSVENMAKSIVFWRAFTQWIGGMGVLVLTLAIMPSGERGVFSLMRAESTGPSSERLLPRVRQSALVLYGIYIALTLIQTIFLLIGKMNLYDALIHAFTTAGTGGFSSRDIGLAAFESSFVEYTIAIFMILFSINFGLYYALFTRSYKRLRDNTELRVFLSMIFISTILIGLNLWANGVYGSAEEIIRQSFFHSASLGSSTAFHLTDYNLWPEFSKVILMILLVIGGCAGSTASGLKVVRISTLCKSAVREVKRIVHPRSVSVVHSNKEPIQDKDLLGTLHYFVIYLLFIVGATMLVSLDKHSMETSFSGVLAMISNVGPGFGAVGPIANYADFSHLSKLVFSVIMLVGRLEIYPILISLMPSTWKRA
ncbi:MAG: TrkH family potassium uptake protein [Oscillospiraceae bacterium]|nr:TrkH family potassium uptake protein [Oscillospiraceae bacterium]